VITQARMFRWKPGGYATHLKAQDANGLPLNLLQDPLHYPQGTKFMAPGPMGQCHEAPEDEDLVNELVRHAANYQRIYDMYNFDYDPPPGSNQYKAMEHIRQVITPRIYLGPTSPDHSFERRSRGRKRTRPAGLPVPVPRRKSIGKTKLLLAQWTPQVAQVGKVAGVGDSRASREGGHSGRTDRRQLERHLQWGTFLWA